MAVNSHVAHPARKKMSNKNPATAAFLLLKRIIRHPGRYFNKKYALPAPFSIYASGIG
jgi:hypothetical protein